MTRKELEKFAGELISIDYSGCPWRGICLVSLDEERVCFYDGGTYEYADYNFKTITIRYDDEEFFNDPEHWIKEHWGKEVLYNIIIAKDNPPKGYKTTIVKSFAKDGMVQNPFTGRWSWL